MRRHSRRSKKIKIKNHHLPMNTMIKVATSLEGSRTCAQRIVVVFSRLSGFIFWLPWGIPVVVAKWKSPLGCRFRQGKSLQYPRRGKDQGESRMVSSGVAGHLALFTAIESRMVEESATVTVPMSTFEVLVPWGCRYWLGGLLFFWKRYRNDLHEILD